MLIPLWAKLAVGVALSGAVALGGYKIGAWKGAADGAAAAATAAKDLATCNASIAAQRESDLSGANHALEDQLREASTLAHGDAQRLADLATKQQRDALAFAANTRALYAISVGTCSFSPDLVGLLRRISDEANAADRDNPSNKTSAPKAGVGDGKPTAIPSTAGKPRTTHPARTGAVGRQLRD
jgi:hypothetical protein